MTALLTLVGLTGCGGSSGAVTPAGPAAPPSTTAITGTPAVDPTSRHPTCSSFVYPTPRTTRISIPVGACLSFERYSDITAVITAVRPASNTLFTTLDVLTYRGVHPGSAIFSVDTKREICTATATCEVANPLRRLTVTVTRIG